MSATSLLFITERLLAPLLPYLSFLLHPQMSLMHYNQATLTQHLRPPTCLPACPRLSNGTCCNQQLSTLIKISCPQATEERKLSLDHFPPGLA